MDEKMDLRTEAFSGRTADPWEPAFRDRGMGHGDYAVMAGGVVIAELKGFCNGDPTANMRLMTAAPALLADRDKWKQAAEELAGRPIADPADVDAVDPPPTVQQILDGTFAELDRRATIEANRDAQAKLAQAWRGVAESLHRAGTALYDEWPDASHEDEKLWLTDWLAAHADFDAACAGQPAPAKATESQNAAVGKAMGRRR
jgi:hypothetical protein